MEPSIRLTAATLDDAEDLGRLQVFVHDAHVANVASYFRPASAEFLGKAMAEKLREADTRRSSFNVKARRLSLGSAFTRKLNECGCRFRKGDEPPGTTGS